jgi:CubicO group peptidase (beta-lactamase class C family)
MLTRRVLLPLAFLAFVSAIPAAEPQVAHPEKLKAIPVAMQKFVESDDISGAVTVVGRKEGIVAFDAVGLRNIDAKTPMAKDTMFRIASMTKPVTAIGIMILADE